MKNRLFPIAPGSTVSWFKKQTFDFVESYHPEPDITTYLSFNLDVYAYICNARPDEKFEEHGGELIVIVVQRGTITNVGKQKMIQVDLGMGISNMTSIIADPKEAENTGDSHKYTIDFAETKAMFKDQGNTSFEAQLEYQDNITRHKYKQSVDNRNTAQYWSIEDFPNSIPDTSPIPFFGLSVFSSTRNLPTLSISHVIDVRYKTELPSGLFARDSSKMDLNFTYKPSTEI